MPVLIVGIHADHCQTSDGKCLFVDELSGDFRANLNPIQVAACDGTAGQKWDIITKGKHNDQAGTILVVNTLVRSPPYRFITADLPRPKHAPTLILVARPETL